MFSKSNLISTLVTAVWGYLGGWLLWGMLMDPILEEHTSGSSLMREMPDMVHLIIGCLIVGFAFSTIYSKWANGNYSPTSGIGYGIWIGILLGFGEGLVNFAVMDMLDITGTLLNGLTYIVFYAVMGLLAGLVYQKTSAA
ncbi:MAG: hypothetical protein R2793_02160 [Flavobacteriaceae bacterium]